MEAARVMVALKVVDKAAVNPVVDKAPVNPVVDKAAVLAWAAAAVPAWAAAATVWVVAVSVWVVFNPDNLMDLQAGTKGSGRVLFPADFRLGIASTCNHSTSKILE